MRILRRRRTWLIGGPLVLIVVALAVLVLAYPSVAATACPRCFSLVGLGDGLYVDREATSAQRNQIETAHAEADRRVAAFYGGRQTHPRVLACFSAECYRHIGGGGERGVAILNRAVMLSPRGIDTVIAAHELSHVEFRHRMGDDAGRVPQWFDEGLAVVVSDDQRYLRPSGEADRCRVEPGGELPATLPEWLAAASADEQTYAKAACRTFRWLKEHNGSDVITAVKASLDSGEINTP